MTLFPVLADSRSGLIQRAEDYTAKTPPRKAFSGFLSGFFGIARAMPPRLSKSLILLVKFDLNVHARGKLKLHQGVNGLISRINNVH